MNENDFELSDEQQWIHRYDGRPDSYALVVAETMARYGLLEFQPLSAAMAAEGAVYVPATVMAGTGSEPVLIISSRGGSDMVRGWTSEGQMLRWTADRTSANPGPLAAPPPPVVPRTWGEDAVLARLLHRPEEIAGTLRILPPDTFTTDVRYDVYTALGTFAGNPQNCMASSVAELARQELGCVPADQMAVYGGEEAPLVGQYVDRLAQTPVYGNRARAIIAALRIMDLRLLAYDADLKGAAQPSPATAEPPGPGPVESPLLEPPPGMEFGGPSGPVPGR